MLIVRSDQRKKKIQEVLLQSIFYCPIGVVRLCILKHHFLSFGMWFRLHHLLYTNLFLLTTEFWDHCAFLNWLLPCNIIQNIFLILIVWFRIGKQCPSFISWYLLPWLYRKLSLSWPWASDYSIINKMQRGSFPVFHLPTHLYCPGPRPPDPWSRPPVPWARPLGP